MGAEHSRQHRKQQRSQQDQRRQMSSPHSTTPSSVVHPHSPTQPPITAQRRNRIASTFHEHFEPEIFTHSVSHDDTSIPTATLIKALTYISNRLLQKTKSHHTFIVTGDIIFSLFFRSRNSTCAVELLQTSTLTAKQKDQLITAVLRAAEKYGISRDDWVNNAGEVALEKEYADEVIARSLVQKEVVYSGDGMTLIAVDFIYELRMMLHKFSGDLERQQQDAEGVTESNAEMERRKKMDMQDMVELVRRLVAVEGKGRSLKKSSVEERYEKLGFSDYAWMMLGEEYERRFGEKGLKANEDDSDDEEGIIMGGGAGDMRDRESIWTDAS